MCGPNVELLGGKEGGEYSYQCVTTVSIPIYLYEISVYVQ